MWIIYLPTGHSNPAYGRGQELSISVKSSRHASSPSRLQPDEPEMVDGSKILENESMFTDATAAQPIKRRRNMIVAYENVIVLRQDTPRGKHCTGKCTLNCAIIIILLLEFEGLGAICSRYKQHTMRHVCILYPNAPSLLFQY